MYKQKRCLIVTNHFYPETFRVNDVAFELVKKGYEVTVLTAVPDYPRGKFYDGYGWFKRRVETINGVRVIHAPIIPRGTGKSIRLALNYLSVIVGFSLCALAIGIKKRYDYIFVHDTSPAIIILPAIIVKWLQKIPLDLWILDMWPESLETGGISNKRVHNVVQRMMDWSYRQCDVIHISSRGFRSMLHKRNVPDEIIKYLPNWYDQEHADKLKIEIPKLPEGFIIMFAGNLGEAQNLENVLAVAKSINQNKSLHWVFLGDGRKRSWMENFVRENALNDTVHLLGRYPIESMSAFFEKADIMLVSLNDNYVFNLTLPAKVQAYMASHKPILAMMNGEGPEIIAEAGCGFAVNADDINAMALVVTETAAMNPVELQKLGENGYNYYMKHFSKEMCIAVIDDSIAQLAK